MRCRMCRARSIYKQIRAFRQWRDAGLRLTSDVEKRLHIARSNEICYMRRDYGFRSILVVVLNGGPRLHISSRNPGADLESKIIRQMCYCMCKKLLRRK